MGFGNLLPILEIPTMAVAHLFLVMTTISSICGARVKMDMSEIM
jgi:hypothetical protein